MLLSKNRHVYWSRVYKQQVAHLKLKVTKEDSHPIKAIFSFLFQNMWLDNQDSLLGEDAWPAQVTFTFEDVVRMIEALTISSDYDEGLFDVYIDLLLQMEEARIHEVDSNDIKSDKTQRFTLLTTLLTHLCELIMQGNSSSK